MTEKQISAPALESDLAGRPVEAQGVRNKNKAKAATKKPKEQSDTKAEKKIEKSIENKSVDSEKKMLPPSKNEDNKKNDSKIKSSLSTTEANEQDSQTDHEEEVRIKRPGRLHMKAKLTLNTVEAQLVFSGKQTKSAVALLQFGKQMTLILQASRLDDPYADWYMFKVFDAMMQLRRRLDDVLKQYEAAFNQEAKKTNFMIYPSLSVSPIERDIWFGTPYGYFATGLVADFDRLMTLFLTAQHVGILFDKSLDKIKSDLIPQFTGLLKLPFRWEPTAITRKDLNQNNDLAQSVVETFKRPPQAVIDQEIPLPFSLSSSSDSERA